MQRLSKAEIRWILNGIRRDIERKENCIYGVENSPLVEIVRLDIENLKEVQRKFEVAINGNDKRIAID